MNSVFVMNFAPPPIDRREMMRYMRAREGDRLAEELVDEVVAECEGVLKYSVCYTYAKTEFSDTGCAVGTIFARSHDLKRVLSECTGAVIFCATVGTGIDRLIMKYSRLSPSRALAIQALGTERVEALCDSFCNFLREKHGDITHRFSAGYGDLPLEIQREVFKALEPEKYIGVTLGEGCVMTPSKSVTAFVGLK